ncbi:MAG: hypothetical protein K0S61_4903 [Anaerocolumna sp.]|nr:hypothetical protein [Anaerocolumna sp.]
MKRYTCPCCGYKTLDEEPPGTYDICPICFWEDDGVQFHKPYFSGGANRLSLIEAQRNYIKFGASEERLLEYVRKPNETDEKDSNWKPFEEHEDTRKEEVMIDLANVKTVEELHLILKEKLGFPNFYGMNWDAFWDSITGLVEMPLRLVLKGWFNIERNFPKDSRIMKECLRELNEEYPSCSCEVFYK